MKIGIDASRAFGGERTGTENYSYQMLKHMLQLPEAKKHEWVIYVRSNFEDLNFKDLKIRVINITIPRLWTQIGLAYRTWVDNLDVLWVPAHTLPVLRKLGLKMVVTIHGIEYEWLPAYENRLQRWYLPLSTIYACRQADKLIAVSKFTQQQLIERLKTNPKKIKVVYEGVENKFLTMPDGRQVFNILKKYGLEEGKYVLFVGTIQPRKNLERLVMAMEAIREKHAKLRNIKLVMAGKWGWGYEELKAHVAQSKYKKQIVMTGYINNTERDTLLAKAIVYVQPSITEGFGLPVIEAMQAGVAVVSSKGGALQEIVGKNGWLFEPTDIKEIEQKITDVLQQPQLRRKLIVAGKKRGKMFSWEKAARETLKILVGQE